MAQFVQRLAEISERAGIRFLADVAGWRRSDRYCGAMRSVRAEFAGVSVEPAVELRNQQVTFAAVANIRAGKRRGLLQIARLCDGDRVSSFGEVGSRAVTIGSGDFFCHPTKLRTSVPTHVPVGRAKAASNPLGELTMAPLWIARSAISPRLELGLMSSSRNFRRLGSRRDRFVKRNNNAPPAGCLKNTNARFWDDR
jgi:hypothetical protein